MRKLTILIMALGLLIWTGTTAQAANDGTVAVTSTITQSLAMTVSPTSWDVPSMTIQDTETTFTPALAGYFTVTNSGNGTSYMDIKAAVTTGSCTLGSTPGANIYRIGYGQATGTAPSCSAPSSYTVITGTDGHLATITAAGMYLFDLELQSPTSTTYGGVQQTITVTITAKTS